MPTTLLAVIHNGELATSPARVVIDELQEHEIVDRVIEISEQPEINELVDRSALKTWRRNQRELENRWRAYLGTTRSTSNLVSRAGQSLFTTRVALSHSHALKCWRARQVESFVTAKHIQAWRAFAASDQALLIVVESDATIRSGTFTAIDAIAALPSGTAFYANLAGGLDRTDIGVEHLVDGRAEHVVTLNRPVTNTSCAYLINHAFATAILSFIEFRPEAASLGVDWLFNAFFLDSRRRQVSITCVHADPPALGHGSLTGVTTSWHPDR